MSERLGNCRDDDFVAGGFRRGRADDQHDFALRWRPGELLRERDLLASCDRFMKFWSVRVRRRPDGRRGGCEIGKRICKARGSLKENQGCGRCRQFRNAGLAGSRTGRQEACKLKRIRRQAADRNCGYDRACSRDRDNPMALGNAVANELVARVGKLAAYGIADQRDASSPREIGEDAGALLLGVMFVVRAERRVIP